MRIFSKTLVSAVKVKGSVITAKKGKQKIQAKRTICERNYIKAVKLKEKKVNEKNRR